MQLSEMRTNDFYSFTTRVPAVLGADFKSLQLIGVMNYAMASRFEAGLAEKHMAALPSLPAGTSRDASSLNYLVFDHNGKHRCFAYDWLHPDSISILDEKNVTISVKLSNNKQLSDLITHITRGGWIVTGTNQS